MLASGVPPSRPRPLHVSSRREVMSTYGTSGDQTGTTGSQSSQHREGQVARKIEQQTAKMPSDWFLWGGLGALATSMILQARHQRGAGNVMGFVAPTLLI